MWLTNLFRKPSESPTDTLIRFGYVLPGNLFALEDKSIWVKAYPRPNGIDNAVIVCTGRSSTYPRYRRFEPEHMVKVLGSTLPFKME